MLQSEYLEKKAEFDLLIEQYKTGERPLSYSSFKSFIVGGGRGFFENRMFKTQSQAMADGVAFHMAVLEPEKYNETYFVFDDTDKCNELINNGAKSPRSSKAYKEWKVEELAKYEGKEEISLDKHNLFQSMGSYLHSNSLTSQYMNKIEQREETVYFKHRGFKWVVKIDAIALPYTIDIKKCANALPSKMSWVIRDMLYDVQGAVTSLATGKFKHCIINIDPSHIVSVFELDGENMNSAIEKLNVYIEKFEECIETDSWNESINFFYNRPEILIVR